VNKRLQCSIVYLRFFIEVYGANCFAIQARIKKLPRVTKLSALWECQPYRIFKRICYAKYAIMRPNRQAYLSYTFLFGLCAASAVRIVATRSICTQSSPHCKPTHIFFGTGVIRLKRVSGGKVMISGIIYVIGGFIEILIGLRFLLRLLGANPQNHFVLWIYNWSSPFVAPFAGIFGQSTTVTGQGIVTSSVFDWAALVALFVYGLILVILTGVTRRTPL
jgi:hypothetical protein